MNTKTTKENTSLTPFEKFTDLTRRLFTVPKKELDEKLEEFKLRQQKKRVAG